MIDIHNIKNITILGAGESGVGAALLAKQKGKNVFISDLKQIEQKKKEELIKNSIPFEEMRHTESIVLSSDLVIKSPGIPDTSSIIKKIRNINIDIISEIDFAYHYKDNSKIIAITGSNGKSTTTKLIYHILNKNGYDVGIAGNIGISFAREVYIGIKKYYVLEVSSFQLDDIYSFKPDIAILLNITPDHLDRYNYQLINYINSKFRITKFQDEKDHFLYCGDDITIATHLNNYFIKAKKIEFTMNKKLPEDDNKSKSNDISFNLNNDYIDLVSEPLPIKGKHNQYNMLAASIAASIMNIKKPEIREALQSFVGLEHRMEYVCTIRGVDYINDSKATNINSTWYALESVSKKCVLILGGVDKGNNYSEILDLVKDNVKAIVCLGKENSKIINFFKDIVPVYDSNNLQTTVEECYRIAEKGDVVLLSPACASFDLFDNYEDRGKKFKNAVKEL